MAMDVDIGAGGSDFDELNSDEPPPKKKAPARKAPATKAPAKAKAPAKKAPAKGKGKKVQVKSIVLSYFNFRCLLFFKKSRVTRTKLSIWMMTTTRKRKKNRQSLLNVPTGLLF